MDLRVLKATVSDLDCHYVYFEGSDRPRTPKASAYYYSKVIERNGFAETTAKANMEIYWK